MTRHSGCNTPWILHRHFTDDVLRTNHIYFYTVVLYRYVWHFKSMSFLFTHWLTRAFACCVMDLSAFRLTKCDARSRRLRSRLRKDHCAIRAHLNSFVFQIHEHMTREEMLSVFYTGHESGNNSKEVTPREFVRARCVVPLPFCFRSDVKTHARRRKRRRLNAIQGAGTPEGCAAGMLTRTFTSASTHLFWIRSWRITSSIFHRVLRDVPPSSCVSFYFRLTRLWRKIRKTNIIHSRQRAVKLKSAVVNHARWIFIDSITLLWSALENRRSRRRP